MPYNAPDVQVFAKSQFTGQYIQLDLIGGEPIRVTFQVYDPFGVGGNVSDISQEFLVPNTTVNGQFFKDACSIDGSSFDASVVMDAYITVDGGLISAGNISLNGVNLDQRHNVITYSIIFSGTTSDFSGSVGAASGLTASGSVNNASLADLDFNFTIDPTITNVQNSWSTPTQGGGGGYYSGDVVFPLTEAGYDYSDTPQPLQNTISYMFQHVPDANDNFNQGSIMVTTPPYFQYLSTGQLKPMFRAKMIWDKIFNSAGYTYGENADNNPGSSTFLGSTMFKNMYCLVDNTERSTTVNNCSFLVYMRQQSFYPSVSLYPPQYSGSMIVYNQLHTPASYNLGQPCQYCNTCVSGIPGDVKNANLVDDSGIFTAPSSGNYTFWIQSRDVSNLSFYQNWQYANIGTSTGTAVMHLMRVNNPSSPVSVYNVNLSYPAGSGTCGSRTYGNSPSLSSFPSFRIFTVTLNKGDKVQWMMDPGAASSYCSASPCGQASIANSFIWLCTDWPKTFTADDFMPDNKKQIDFIKAIAERFKLVFVPDPWNPKNFIEITPWKDWIKAGRNLDWSEKLDSGTVIQTSPLFLEQPRSLFLHDQEDSDYPNNNYQKVQKNVYGWLKADTGRVRQKGTLEPEPFFSATPLDIIGFNPKGDSSFVGAGGSPNFIRQAQVNGLFPTPVVIPHICKIEGGDGSGNAVITFGSSVPVLNPIAPNIRLLYYNGLIQMPTLAKNNDPTYQPEFYMQDLYGTASSPSSKKWPLASMFTEWPVTSTTLDLAWNNATGATLTPIQPLVNTYTPNDVYSVYWSKWWNCMQDPFARKVQMKLKLNFQDICNLRFNDRVFIDGNYYFVTKISDYPLGQLSTVTVDLIKINNWEL